MRISEIFYSIQGEGTYTGLPMVFVRFQGCPLRCTWCDSKYTWEFKGGEELPLDAVLARVAEYPTKHICITGGEPLAHLPDFLALAKGLKKRGYWIEVETAGAHRLPMEDSVHPSTGSGRTVPAIDSWVMDIKCPGSGMEQHNKYAEVSRLREEDQLKFVVADRADFDFALRVLGEHKPRCHVLFSPVWDAVDLAALAEWVKNETPQARLSLQVHKVIWGEKRGV
ncbi:MAG: radical SAM protein [Chloroflexi bacterium]|nr:radical SAM protein [Chloroflexota bacterium]